jgi:hypothetical protein
MTAITLLPGRSCEGCTLCCKVVAVPTINKPRLEWCTHCAIGGGCKIFGQPERPAECADYFCWYRQSASLGEEWHPNTCHMVLSYEAKAKRVNVCVDPDFAMAWRAEPYYSRIKAMALSILRQGGHLVVWQGVDGVGVLPDRDVFLGPPTGNQVIIAGPRRGVATEIYDIVAIDRNDPRLSSVRNPMAPRSPDPA